MIQAEVLKALHVSEVSISEEVGTIDGGVTGFPGKTPTSLAVQVISLEHTPAGRELDRETTQVFTSNPWVVELGGLMLDF